MERDDTTRIRPLFAQTPAPDLTISYLKAVAPALQSICNRTPRSFSLRMANNLIAPMIKGMKVNRLEMLASWLQEVFGKVS
jgi:hypothetical protein